MILTKVSNFSNKSFFVFVVYITCLLLSVDLSGQKINYHPNEWWQVDGNINKPDATSFPFRYFNPQYTFPQRLENGKWRSEVWKDWMNDNHMTYPYQLVGHSWQNFITSYKQTLLKHPEYLAEVKGKRLGVGKANKLCVSNKELQALFIEYVLKQFVKLDDKSASVSVEPTDGGNFCECKECRKLGGISNQVFFLANLSAKAVKEKYPQGKVNLYAYFSHAEPPDFSLEDNVHVTVIPDGFQYINDPEVLMYEWSKKAKILTYYDYIGIPQWKGELPLVSVPYFLKRMELSKKLGYQGYWHEVGLNINNALILQLLSQMWKDPSLKWEVVFDKFIKDCFPNCQEPMKRLFNRWHSTWLGRKEIEASLFDLREALKKAKFKTEKERLYDLMAYVHYNLEYLNWRYRPETDESSERFFSYVFKCSNRLIINQFALNTIFDSRVKNKAIKNKYNFFRNKDWSFVEGITSKEIRENFKTDLKTVKPVKIQYNNYNVEDLCVHALSSGLKPINYYSSKIKNSDYLYVFSKGPVELNIKNIVDQKIQGKDLVDSKLQLSLISDDLDFISSEKINFIEGRLNRTLLLPANKVIKMSFYQFQSATLDIKGDFVVVLDKSQVKDWNKNYSSYIDNTWKTVEKNTEFIESPPYYFMFKE